MLCQNLRQLSYHASSKMACLNAVASSGKAPRTSTHPLDALLCRMAPPPGSGNQALRRLQVVYVLTHVSAGDPDKRKRRCFNFKPLSRRRPQLWLMPCAAWLKRSDVRAALSVHGSCLTRRFHYPWLCTFRLAARLRGHLLSALGAVLASPAGLQAAKDDGAVRR